MDAAYLFVSEGVRGDDDCLSTIELSCYRLSSVNIVNSEQSIRAAHGEDMLPTWQRNQRIQRTVNLSQCLEINKVNLHAQDVLAKTAFNAERFEVVAVLSTDAWAAMAARQKF